MTFIPLLEPLEAVNEGIDKALTGVDITCCQSLAAQSITALVLIWDNASWHKSQIVRTWLRNPNRTVKQTGEGVRILSCLLPSKSPWLNSIEPKWVHGKRNVSEDDRVLSADEPEARVCLLRLFS